jgi:hypothetical protein
VGVDEDIPAPAEEELKELKVDGRGLNLVDEDAVCHGEGSRLTSVRRWFTAEGLGLGLWGWEELNSACVMV